MKQDVTNRRLAKSLLNAMNSRDINLIKKCIAETAEFDFPGLPRMEGGKRIAAFFKLLFRKYPKLEFDIKDIVEDEDRACVIWSNTGEDAEGTPYQNQGVTYMRMSNNLIDFISDYFKDTSFL